MKPFFFLFIAILILSSCDVPDKGRSVPPNEYLTVILSNETAYPIQVALPRAYYNLTDFSQVSHLPKDTLRLPIHNGFAFAHFSHRNTTGDTVLVGMGDTLRLSAKEDNIAYELLHWSDSIPRFEKAYDAFTQGTWHQNVTRELDSIKSIFFPLDMSTKPIRWNYEHSYSLSRILLKTDPALFKEKRAVIEHYFQLAKSQHDSTIAFLARQREYPKSLIAVVRQSTEYSLFNRLIRFSSAPIPFLTDSLLSQTGADFYRQSDLLTHPHSISFISAYIHRIQKPEVSRTRGKMYTNYKPVYDDAAKLFNDSIANFARFLSLEWMIEAGEAFPEVESRFQHFKQTSGEQHLIELLESKYLFDLQQYRNASGDLKLMDNNRRVLSLADLMERSSGKLVYVDFWASWCGPCRDAMPDSRLLKADYQGKDVVVVYISTDKDVDAWHGASKAERLEDYPYSFIVLNQDMADFIRQIALKEIPRYLLFDKQGKLVHQDAPGPKGKEIRTLVNRYLSQ